jgi:hypothetical protein
MTILYIENEIKSTRPKYPKKYVRAIPISMFGPNSSCKRQLGYYVYKNKKILRFIDFHPIYSPEGFFFIYSPEYLLQR